MVKLALCSLSMLLISIAAYSNEEFDPQNVTIDVEHGMEVANKRLGFRLSIANWIPEEKIIVIAIAPSGERIQLDNDSVYADENGLCNLGIDYEREGFYQGTWVLVVAGEAGFHYFTVQLPTVTPPTESNENWVVNFGEAT